MIDLNYLAQQTSGDKALQCELLGLFWTQVDDLHAILEREPDAADRDLAAVVHRVRGAAVAVGASGLGAALERTESDVVSRCFIPEARASVVAALDQARADLSRLIAALQSPGLAKPRESR